jgi:hypothetical protein
MRRVRHVETKDVHARVDELADHLSGISRGAKGRNDFSAADCASLHLRIIRFIAVAEKFLIRLDLEIRLAKKNPNAIMKTQLNLNLWLI